MNDWDRQMDGGVTAAAIEAEVVSPERARSLVQERDEAKAEAAMCQTSLRGQICRAEKAEDTLLMVQQQRDHLRATLTTTARQRDEADKRAARSLTAREHLEAAWDAAHVVPAGTAIAPGLGYITRYEGSGEILASIEGHSAILPTRGIWGERRLLAPEPPSRPEGAEGLADDLSGWDEMDDYGNRRFTHEELDDLADHLAARGWKKGEK